MSQKFHASYSRSQTEAYGGSSEESNSCIRMGGPICRTAMLHSLIEYTNGKNGWDS